MKKIRSDYETQKMVARRFVRMITAYQIASDPQELSFKQVEALLYILAKAGFSAIDMKPGHVEHDGKALNLLFPYKPISRYEGHDPWIAAGWLNDVVKILKLVQPELSFNKKVTFVIKEMKRSMPLNPIFITKDGDMLFEIPPDRFFSSYLVDHVNDSMKIGHPAGIHGKTCGGKLYRGEISGTQSMLRCSKCEIRALFPKTLQTYGDLRNILEKCVHSER